MTKSFPVLTALGLIYFAIQLLTGGNYNIFRDEYYYIDCAKHLAFGYVDHPPFSIVILAAWKAIFSDSQLSIRIIPALLGGGTVVTGGFIAASMGGNKSAQILSAIAVLCSPVFLGLGSIYSMNSFDLLFWAAMFYVLIKIINTDNEKLWLWFGMIAGLGLMNKISVGYLGAGIVIAMMFTKERKWFKNKYFWLGGVIAVIIFSPYIIWNMQNDFATLEFIRNAAKFKNAQISFLGFLKEQILQINPLNAIIWITGLIALLIPKRLSKYRIVAIVYIVVFIILVLNNGKPYYLAAAYISLIPAGSIALTEFFEKRRLKFLTPVYAILLLASGVIISPMAIPVLTPERLVEHMDKLGIKPENAEKSKLGLLPQFFADRFGWEEMAKEMAKVYNTMSDEEKKKTVIAVGNYGEASSLNYYAKKYGLPVVYCAHNSHWFWGKERGFEGIDNVIILDGKREDHLEQFEEVTEAGKISNPYAMPFENNLTIFIARHLRPGIDLKEVWKKEKDFI
jgi:hypothetical protein